MITFFGQTNFRGLNKKFGIKEDDRRKHMYVIGKTGMGKTELLKNMAIQDILNGHGLGFIDPHGDAAEELLDFIPKERIKDVVYINPADFNHPVAFNIMENVSPDEKHLVAGGLMGVFKKIWPDVWSARMEYILNNAILALLEIEGSTLLGVNRLLSDAEWREKIVAQLKDPVVKAFWTQEFAKYSQKYEIEATAAIQNKIGQFISSALIRNIIGQSQSTIDVREIMDSQKILIVNLSKGKVGEDSSRLLGALLITKIQLAAMSRVDMEEHDRKDFFLYVDEFQNFATESFATILSEARKYRLALILAHQYIAQMDDSVRDAVFGNIGTLLTFRVGAEDADFLEREFTPELTSRDIVNLSKQNIYVKLMIDGLTSRPFSAKTLPPREIPEKIYVEDIVNYSRKKYAKIKDEVEKVIEKEIGEQEKKENKIPELYDAVCDMCGKQIKVPFKPEKDKKIYCKSCLKKKQQQKQEEHPKQETISLFREAKEFTPLTKEDKEKKEQKQKKQVEVGGLRDLLLQAKEDQKKEIRPGQSIKFDE